MEKILRKSYKILGLAIFIFISSLIFVFWQIDFWLPESRVADEFRIIPLGQGFSFNPGASESKFEISNFPSPENFSTFSYPETKKLNLAIKCQDFYYTILIFNNKDDYRQEPAAARFNSAFPCQEGEQVTATVDLEKLNLTEGKYYYFVADQGLAGSWYNPR